MTTDEIKDILTYNIPLEGLALNSGIYEFYVDSYGNSMGVSYETLDDGEEVYIFNIFKNGEYIQVNGEYSSIYDVVDELKEEWGRLNV